MRQERPILTRLPALMAVLLMVACTSSPPDPTTAAPAGSVATPAVATPTLAPGATPTEAPSPSSSPGEPTPTPVGTPEPTPTPTPHLPAGEMPTTITAELSSALQATVRSEMARIGAPGMSVAIRLPSGELWTGVSGFAAFSPDRPVTRKTVFAIASISKTFVATLIMKLAEDGVLTIDDPLADYLPDFRRARRITLRMLLSHTSGVFDYFTSAAYAREVFADTTRRWTFDEILGFVGPSYCRPGECYHYSNTNFVLLGRVAELATGEPIAQLLRERLFDPAGLTRTIFQPDATTPLDAAHGFLTNRRGFVDHTGESRVIPHMSAATVAWSAGAIASTPSDLALWASSLYGGHVLAPESLAQMLTFRPDDDYGLGTRLHIYRGRTCVGHTGSIRGFANEMWYFPDDGVSIVMLQNRGKILTHNVIKAILGTLTGVSAAP